MRESEDELWRRGRSQHQRCTSVFRPRHSEVYTADATLRAEAALLARAEDRTAPTIREHNLRAWRTSGRRLTSEQITTLAQVATSGRSLDLLLGPAGAGKTTAMSALKDAWEKTHGRHSVIGLAPSAASAQVLADDLGIACENTAKWLYEHSNGEEAFAKNQLVIIDETTLASTATLDEIDKIVYATDAAAAGLTDHLAGSATVVGLGETVTPDAVLDDLAARGVQRLMVEGGGTIHTMFLTAGLADELYLVFAPFFVGNDNAPRFVNPSNFPRDPSHRMKLAETRQIGDCVLLRYLPR